MDLIVIILVAFVFRFESLGNPVALTPIIGFLIVPGTYLLVRKMFNKEIAAISAFLLASSSWHMLISRTGFHEVAGAMLLVWALYFFWKGKTSLHLMDFAISGVLMGAGFYTSLQYWLMPLIVIVSVIALWEGIELYYHHDSHAHPRLQLMRGFAMMMVSALVVAFPIISNFFLDPGLFARPTLSFSNVQFNLHTVSFLFWPVAILSIFGCIRSVLKCFITKRTHGHFPPSHILLLSWLLLGVLHPLGYVFIAPVLYVFAGEALWWLYDFSRKWYNIYDKHEVIIHEHHGRESTTVAMVAIGALLLAIMLNEHRTSLSYYEKNIPASSSLESRN